MKLYEKLFFGFFLLVFSNSLFSKTVELTEEEQWQKNYMTCSKLDKKRAKIIMDRKELIIETFKEDSILADKCSKLAHEGSIRVNDLLNKMASERKSQEIKQLQLFKENFLKEKPPSYKSSFWCHALSIICELFD